MTRCRPGLAVFAVPLIGQEGDDQIYGGDGNDVLNAWTERTSCTGGDGGEAADLALQCEIVSNVPLVPAGRLRSGP